jgi:hypothetical protein
MPTGSNSLTLNIDAGTDADEEERLDLVRRLREALLALSEVENIESPYVPPIAASKAVGIDWQTLVVTLAASGGVLTTLITNLQAWLTRYERASVTVEVNGDKLEVKGASSEVQRRLVDDWISRHKSPHSKQQSE